MQEVLRLYDAAGGVTEAGAVPARVLPLDPPNELYEGLLYLSNAVAIVRGDQRRREREKSESEQRARRAAAGMRRHG